MAERARKPKKPMPPGFKPRETIAYAKANEGLVELTSCPKCGAPVLRGYIDAIVTSLDPVPLDPQAEAALKLHGVSTFEARRFGGRILATFRSMLSFGHELRTRRRAGAVFPEHRCQP